MEMDFRNVLSLRKKKNQKILIKNILTLILNYLNNL